MVCRTTRIGSAVTSYARLASGLEDQQCLSTFHDLMREGRAHQAPTAEALNALVDDHLAAVAADPTLTDARRRSITMRLNEARTQDIDGRTFYAATRLRQSTTLARAALNTHFDGLARDLGVSRAQVEADVAGHMREAADSGRGMSAPTAWRQAFGAQPENTHLPLDRQTAYALHLMEQRRTARRAAAPQRPTVTRQPVNSSAVRAVGYDPASQRLEVEMVSRPGVPYAYRVPAHVHAEMMASPSVGSYYARHIRGESAYRYDSAAEHDAAGLQRQCATCGQWAGADHSCPTRDSAEEREATERQARQALAARRARTAAPAPSAPGDTYEQRVAALEAQGLDRSDAQASVEAQDHLAARSEASATASASASLPFSQRAQPRHLGYRAQRPYLGDGGTFRCASLTYVRQDVRQHGTATVDIGANVQSPVVDGSVSTVSVGHVNGRVQVTYNGRGQGYSVTAADTAEGQGRGLRCSCTDYRNRYDCVHVRQAVADVQTRLNQDRLRDPHRIAAAASTVAADLSADHDRSEDAQALSQSTWGEPEVSYVEDHAAFQSAYTAAKERIARGEQAVPYMTENATDGLGARGTGRAFGVELEFDITPGVDRYTALAAIGRDLHAAGLTRSTSQSYYHAAASRGYTENHQGGWSYEDDCTVHGEIVSPIMYDTPETWQNIQTVCDIVRRHGGAATVRTGSHVHVSAGNYDHTVDNHTRLMASFRQDEDVIYRMSTNPERGSHRGPQWCRPNNVPASGYSSVSQAQSLNNGHGLGVNLQSVNGRSSDHIEFRTWDGTLEPSVIQAQIKMSLGMTEAAFRDTDHRPSTAEPLGSHRSTNRREHGASRRLTGEAWRADTATFRAFTDRLFRRAADKEQITALFAATKWQRSA